METDMQMLWWLAAVIQGLVLNFNYIHIAFWMGHVCLEVHSCLKENCKRIDWYHFSRH